MHSLFSQESKKAEKKALSKSFITFKVTDVISIPEDFWIKAGEHLILTLFAVCAALPIALGVSILTHNRPFLQNILTSFMNLFQTIPSLALFAFLIPWLGIGTVPALCVLSLYAILPILRNSITSLQECPPYLIEAAQIFGLNKRQILFRVQFPQSLPFIISGIRTSFVWTIGTASLATFIGAGGLGDYIARGIALLDTSLLLVGAIPIAFLAIVFDLIFSKIEKSATLWKQGKSSH